MIYKYLQIFLIYKYLQNNACTFVSNLFCKAIFSSYINLEKHIRRNKVCERLGKANNVYIISERHGHCAKTISYAILARQLPFVCFIYPPRSMACCRIYSIKKPYKHIRIWTKSLNRPWLVQEATNNSYKF